MEKEYIDIPDLGCLLDCHQRPKAEIDDLIPWYPFSVSCLGLLSLFGFAVFRKTLEASSAGARRLAVGAGEAVALFVVNYEWAIARHLQSISHRVRSQSFDYHDASHLEGVVRGMSHFWKENVEINNDENC